MPYAIWGGFITCGLMLVVFSVDDPGLQWFLIGVQVASLLGQAVSGALYITKPRQF